VPRAASANDMYKSWWRLSPSRLMVLSSSSSMIISKSPDTPFPKGASLPLPLTLSCIPSLAPAGISIFTSSSSRIFSHGLFSKYTILFIKESNTI